MHAEIQSRQSQSNLESAAEVLLRIARSLHRSVSSESLSVSLPELRLLLATSTLTAISLPELQRNRDSQRAPRNSPERTKVSNNNCVA